MIRATKTCDRQACGLEFVSKYSPGKRPYANEFCSRACRFADISERAIARLWAEDREQGIPDDCRKCRDCKQIKSLTCYPKVKKDFKGRNKACKDCIRVIAAVRYAKNAERNREVTKAWKINNPEKVKATLRKRLISKRGVEIRHNMLKGSWWVIFRAQGERCANKRCNAAPGDKLQFWQVDHDHNCCPGANSCGKCVRGILCFNCNRAAGALKDDVERILGLADYLTS